MLLPIKIFIVVLVFCAVKESTEILTEEQRDYDKKKRCFGFFFSIFVLVLLILILWAVLSTLVGSILIFFIHGVMTIYLTYALVKRY